jgi:hypothetical protein
MMPSASLCSNVGSLIMPSLSSSKVYLDSREHCGDISY